MLPTPARTHADETCTLDVPDVPRHRRGPLIGSPRARLCCDGKRLEMDSEVGTTDDQSIETDVALRHQVGDAVSDEENAEDTAREFRERARGTARGGRRQDDPAQGAVILDLLLAQLSVAHTQRNPAAAPRPTGSRRTCASRMCPPRTCASSHSTLTASTRPNGQRSGARPLIAHAFRRLSDTNYVVSQQYDARSLHGASNELQCGCVVVWRS